MLQGMVLLVEDHAVVQVDFEEMFLQYGARQVQVAPTVSEALRMLDSEKFELLVSEWKLDGDPCLPIFEKAQDRKVGSILATRFDVDRAHYPQLENFVMLRKPFGPEDVAKALKSALLRPAV